MTRRFFSIAIDIPLNTLFTYSSETQIINPVGCRVSVPFGKKQKLALVLAEQKEPQFDLDKIKAITKWIDKKPILDSQLINLIQWAANYYLYPLPAAIFTLLPSCFRKAKGQDELFSRVFSVVDDDKGSLKRAKKQKKLYNFIKKVEAVSLPNLQKQPEYGSVVLKQLLKKELVLETKKFSLDSYQVPIRSDFLLLNEQQQSAFESIKNKAEGFNVLLLEGVTGSGKTEVYHHIIREVLQKALQVLVLVPEIGLTPQLLDRLRIRFGNGVFCLHSEMSDKERAKVWLGCRTLDVKILVGTRSSLFSPFRKLGLIIVDEEHDNSLKQQKGFRYHARDLAIVLAKKKQIPVILGSATPSYESYSNTSKGHFHHLKLTERAGHSKAPKMQLLDLNKGSIQEGISDRLLPVIKKHLEEHNQVLFFINRRGFSPVLMCDKCRWIKDCDRCDSHMTMHYKNNTMKCHHCGSQAPVPTKCSECGEGNIIAIGQGTERIENYLTTLFPDKKVLRIDRDSTTKKEALEKGLKQINNGEVDILIGTQMLSKGHHFKNVTLVVILNADGGMYSGDYRSFEQTAQQIIQVAGRAGREEKPGEVIIQTQFVENESLRQLVREGYTSCANKNITERIDAGFPPASRCVLLRAQGYNQKQVANFLILIANWLDSSDFKKVRVLGPAISPIERISGHYRMQLLLLSTDYNQIRSLGLQLFKHLYDGKFGRRVRWSLDVDPVNLN